MLARLVLLGGFVQKLIRGTATTQPRPSGRMVRQPFRPGQPEQAQTLDQTLASYTCDNAWVEFAEARKGMLTEGYLADLVLLDGDIEAAPKEAIRELTVRATICDGQVTYEA